MAWLRHLAVAACLTIATMQCARADATDSVFFDIPQQRADLSLTEFAKQANRTLVFPFDVARAKTANALIGEYPIDEGLKRLLAGTGLRIAIGDGGELTVFGSETRPEEPVVENKRNPSFVRQLFGAVTAVLVAGQAHAGDARTVTDSGQIEEITVTATREEASAQSVPIPVSAVTGEQLRDRAAFQMSDLARVTPNLSYVNSGVSKNSANIFLRGIGQTNWGPAQDPKVGVYLNGVYLARPQGGIFDLVDVERVEVLRGPQGTLFGRNTTAGLIQVITRRPTDQFEVDVKAGAGTDNQNLLLGVVNIPFADTLAGRFVLQHRANDGYVHNRYDGKDWNDRNADTGRATLSWTPTDNFEATLGLDYQRVREKPSLATCRFLGPQDGATAGGVEFFAWVFGTYDAIRSNCLEQSAYKSYENDPDNRSDIDQWGSTLTLNWNIDGIGDLTSITAYRNMDEINGSWGFVSDSPIGSVLEIQQPPHKTNNFDQVSQELRLHGVSFGDRLDWQAGVYFFEENAEQYFGVPLLRNSVAPDCAVVPQFCFPTPAGPTLGQVAQGLQTFGSVISDYDAKNQSRAIYGEATYHVTSEIDLTAGIRYTEDKRRLDLVQTLFSGVPDPGYVCPDGSLPVDSTCTKKTGTMDENTPRVILSYHPSDAILVYGSWSKGYSSGGINQTPRLEGYDPETSKNWELGFKSNLFDRRVQFNMTTFYNTYENQQQSVGRIVDNQPVVAILNAQKATLWGVEGELTAVPADGWLIKAVAGYTHGEYDKFEVTDTLVGPPPDLIETSVVRDLSDTKVVRGPPYTYSVSIAKTFELGGDSALTVQSGWSYFARRFDNLEANANTRQDPYGLLDARILWQYGNAGVSIWGTNLLDTQYTTEKINGATGDNIQRVYWGPPRMVGLELTYSFAK